MAVKNYYYAFISYSHKDKDFAEWLHKQFEHYHLPSKILEDNPEIPEDKLKDIPQKYDPVFMDEKELSSGILAEELTQALDNSTWLIVLCSPDSATSDYVNPEIEHFIESTRHRKKRDGSSQDREGQIRHIVPIILSGTPYASNETEECFPRIFKELKEESNIDILAINGKMGVLEKSGVKEDSWERSFIGALAYMLELPFDVLWDRRTREIEEEQRKLKEQNDRLLIAQSRFVAEKATNLIKRDSYLARLLAIEMLPKDLDNPNRPYTPEAEQALREIAKHNSAVLYGHDGFVMSVCFSPDKENRYILSSSLDNTIRLWETKSGNSIILPGENLNGFNFATFSPDGKTIAAAACDNKIHLWKWRIDKERFEYFTALIGHSAGIKSVMFSPIGNGKLLVSASDDGTIKIWDTLSGQEKKTEMPLAHDNKVNYATFSPNGKLIASSSLDCTIRVWSTESGMEIHPPLKGS